MSDVSSSTPTNAAAPAAAQDASQAKKGAAEQSQANQPQASQSNAAGGKSTPTSNAIDEVMKTLPGNQSEVTEEEDDGSDLPPETEAKKLEKLKKKLKVQGKEIEVDEDELVKRAQMGYSAEEKWNEAAKMRKQVENFIGLLQQDPAAALEKMGFDVDALAEARIQQRIEEMKKSPEQIEREKIQRELETLKAEREKEREELRQRETQALQDKYAIDLENEINSAFDSNQGLPKSPYIVKRMADVMIYALQNKVPNFTAKQALEIVQNEIHQELNEMYSVAPDEVFEKLVGKDRLNKYRRSKVKARNPTPKTSSVKQTGAAELQKTQEEQAPKKISARDFFKNLGSK